MGSLDFGCFNLVFRWSRSFFTSVFFTFAGDAVLGSFCDRILFLLESAGRQNR